MRRLILSLPLLLSVLAAPAAAQQLAPYKDDLFAYPATLSEADGGAYRVVDYREARDIDQRDQIPERQVRRQYISLGVNRQQKDMKLESPVGPLRFFAVGKQSGASMIVLYLHGQGGNRRQGVNDMTFGGNFNRVKNLVSAAGGLYLTPEFSSFGDKGAAEVAALIEHVVTQSPKARVFIACGSMGGALCWNLAGQPQIVERLGGMLLPGSLPDDGFLSSSAYKRKVPVFFGHGGKDKVFPVERQEAFYRKLRGKSGSYPTRFVRFENGTHGTPIRMVDWRETLNWMLGR